MLQNWVLEQRRRGRAYQPSFQRRHLSVTWLGALLAIALAVGLTVLLGQQLRCLHPPAGGLAFLGVALGATPPFVLTPVLSGSLLLVLIAAAFSRWVKGALPYPHHWL